MKQKNIFRLYAILVVLFCVIILVMPPNQVTIDRYHLDITSYRVLLFVTLVIPSTLTWLAAFYGYWQLQRYTDIVEGTKEGMAFSALRRGCKWVALYLPLVAVATALLSAFANKYGGFRPFAQVTATYLVVVLALVGFTAISNGARQLAETLRVRPSLFKTRVLTLSFIVMGVIYCYFVVSHGQKDPSPYHLPLGWLLLTVVMPFFYAWILGLLAVLDIDAYASKVKGVLYQRALRLLSGGVLTIVLSSILLQYISSATLERGRLVLGGYLVLRYILYATLAAGFVLIAHSAKKLQQIEKV